MGAGTHHGTSRQPPRDDESRSAPRARQDLSENETRSHPSGSQRPEDGTHDGQDRSYRPGGEGPRTEHEDEAADEPSHLSGECRPEHGPGETVARETDGARQTEPDEPSRRCDGADGAENRNRARIGHVPTAVSEQGTGSGVTQASLETSQRGFGSQCVQAFGGLPSVSGVEGPRSEQPHELRIHGIFCLSRCARRWARAARERRSRVRRFAARERGDSRRSHHSHHPLIGLLDDSLVDEAVTVA